MEAPPVTAKPSPTAQIDAVRFSTAYASPSIRRFARELGVDLGAVTGSGRKQRIVKQDVQAFVKHSLQNVATRSHHQAAVRGVQA